MSANVLINFYEVLVEWLTIRGVKKITTDLFSSAGISTFGGFSSGNLVMNVAIPVPGIRVSNRCSDPNQPSLFSVNMAIEVIKATSASLIVSNIRKIRTGILEVSGKQHNR